MTRARDIAFIAALLLTAASFALALPGRASAANPPCADGQLCIWEHADYKGRKYRSGGSDRNLSDNFFPNTRRVVANRGTALYNNGSEGPLDDVVFFAGSLDDDIDPKDASFCLRRDRSIRKLTRNWNDRIVGYRWATDSECEDAGLG